MSAEKECLLAFFLSVLTIILTVLESSINLQCHLNDLPEYGCLRLIQGPYGTLSIDVTLGFSLDPESTVGLST